MAKEIRIVIVEDDPFSRDLMSMLLTRDWRTQVVGEAGTFDELEGLLDPRRRRIDLIILDSEYPGEPDWPFEVASRVEKQPGSPAILYAGTRYDRRVSQRVAAARRGGYVLKNEILYALPSAASFVFAGHLVITPGIWADAPRLTFPVGTLVLDGRKTAADLTRRERELVRLSMVFNLSIRDIADELVLSQGWVSEIVSAVYRKLGMREILSGEVSLNDYFEDAAVLEHCEQIIREAKSGQNGLPFRKGPWMATLAFHLITQPRVQEA